MVKTDTKKGRDGEFLDKSNSRKQEDISIVGNKALHQVTELRFDLNRNLCTFRSRMGQGSDRGIGKIG